jgi:phospholipid/cholesterol/gamma-HCH transport system substrate-binding protein
MGAFVLAAIGAVFGFVYWLHNTGGLGKREVYQIKFEKTVSGLLTGAAVLFNGIRVGEVTGLQIDKNEPRQILVTVAVAADTPVRPDTYVGLEFQGLTGVPVIALEGRGNAAANWPATGKPPLLLADPTAGQSMTQAAREALKRFEQILAENAEPLKTTLAGLSTFATALGRNSDRLDGIVAGIERMVGGGPASAPPVVYELAAPRNLPNAAKDLDGQLAVPEPTAVIMFDTQKILVRPSGGDDPSFTNARWSDTLPKLIQSRVIQSFENAKLERSVARPLDTFTADYQLLIDIRGFQISTAGDPVANVEFSAKILKNDGKILDARIFQATVPAKAVTAPAAAAALNEAFGKVATEIVAWTAKAI